jgi:hypothetical protein
MVILAAVMLMIVGGFSLIGSICGAGGIAMVAVTPEVPRAKGQPPDPLATQRFIAKEVPGYYPFVVATMTFDLLIGIGQIAAGIALLRMSSLARMAAIVLTLMKLLLSCVGHVYNGVLVMPVQAKFLEENPQVPASFTQSLTVALLAVTIIFQLAFSALILVPLLLKSTRDAFAAASRPPAEEEERPRSRYEGYDDEDVPPETGITERPS